MKNNKIINEIFKTGKVIDSNNKEFKLDFNISEIEGEFVWSIIKENRNITNTIEIGCAYGISSLFICDALSDRKHPQHLIIDPKQSSRYKSIGIYNLERAGFTSFELIEKPSEIVLPALLEAGKKFDFALIDGWHTFDQVLLDFYFINKMLAVGGFIVFDDVRMVSIYKAICYIKNYPSYTILSNIRHFDFGDTKKARFIRKLSQKIIPNYLARKLLPKSLYIRVFAPTMVAFKKIKEDDRHSKWYFDF